MSHYKITFFGTERSDTNDVELECFLNYNNEIFISINDNYPQFICLDKSTAIKLAKTLRTEINRMEVSNG
jgi:hypothetical protein